MSGAPELGFEEFYRLEFGRVVGAIRSLVGSRAEDIAQDAFVVAHDRWAEVRDLDRPSAWVRKVALRMAWRHRGREAARGRIEELGSSFRVAPDVDLDLVAALAGLPDRHAAALRLHHLQDQPIADVARALGCSVPAAKVLVMRARQQLGRRLRTVDGRWVTERNWTPGAIARHVAAFAGEHCVGPILDEDLRGVGGRWELSIDGAGYRLERSDGLHIDHGRFSLDGRRATIDPSGNPGTASFRFSTDGDRVKIHDVATTLPPTRGVADEVWLDLFLQSGPFRYVGPARPM